MEWKEGEKGAKRGKTGQRPRTLGKYGGVISGLSGQVDVYIGKSRQEPPGGRGGGGSSRSRSRSRVLRRPIGQRPR